MKKSLILLGLIAGLTATGAQAQTPTYVGKWASNPLQCLVDQSMPAAPLILGAKRYDQHEAHCRFSGLKRTAANAWRAQARCSVEGDTQRHAMSWAVSGNLLTIREGKGSRTLIRC